MTRQRLQAPLLHHDIAGDQLVTSDDWMAGSRRRRAPRRRRPASTLVPGAPLNDDGAADVAHEEGIEGRGTASALPRRRCRGSSARPPRSEAWRGYLGRGSTIRRNPATTMRAAIFRHRPGRKSPRTKEGCTGCRHDLPKLEEEDATSYFNCILEGEFDFVCMLSGRCVGERLVIRDEGPPEP